MLSKRCKYALKAMVCLAEVYQKGHIKTAAIAEQENIPKKFLEQILLELKRWKLVISKQGIVGGYYMIKSPTEVSLADLYRIFDGPIALTPCVSLNYYEKCDDCEDEAICYLRKGLEEVRDKTRKSLMEATIQSFVDNKRFF